MKRKIITTTRRTVFTECTIEEIEDILRQHFDIPEGQGVDFEWNMAEGYSTFPALDGVTMKLTTTETLEDGAQEP